MKYIFKIYLIIVFLFQIELKADSFKYNSYNNHGVIGLINMPTARFYDEQSHGLTIYDGTPDQKITLSSSPYDWLEASLFYTNIQGLPYPGYEYQDYKDKGFYNISSKSNFGIQELNGVKWEMIVGHFRELDIKIIFTQLE